MAVFLALCTQDPVQRLIDELAVQDDCRRIAAARKLRELGAEARPAIPALVRRLRNPGLYDDRVGEECTRTVVAVGKAAAPELLSALRRGESFARRARDRLRYQHHVWVIRALGELEVAEAEPILTRLLRGARGAAVRVEAARALWQITGRPEPSRAVLTRELRAGLSMWNSRTWFVPPDADSRRAAEALGALGPEAAPAVPALLAALGSHVRGAEDALLSIGRAGVPQLARALRDEKLWRPATRILGALGPAAVAALPALKAKLGNVDARKARVIREAMRKIGE